MPFFDELGKKITQVSQTAVQKTRDASDTMKLNSSISEEERNIERCWKEIGKLYASIHSTDFDKPFEPLMESIHGSEAKIQGYRQQIQTIKGVMRCEKCGSEVPAGAAFCNTCGAPMPKQTPTASVISGPVCPACGAPVGEGLSFCTSCGTPLKAASTSEDTSIPVSEADQQGSQCPHCGKINPAGTVFCVGCGERMDIGKGE